MRNKSISELEYIIKDAGEAAICMKDVNPAAESKYLDQVNDAATELYRRRNPAPRVKRAKEPKRSYAW